MKETLETVVLPTLPDAGGSYAVANIFGGRYIYVSGCGPNLNGKVWNGRMEEAYSTEEGARAAEGCARNMLAAIKAQIGSLSRIQNVVKLIVFVASPAGYTKQSIVANGATDFLIDLFGDPCGRPARSAIGVACLPNNIPVEIEGLFEFDPED